MPLDPPNLDDRTFQDIVDETKRLIPRFTPEQDEQSSGTVQIRIAYRVRATNDRRNLVYPFYVIPREDA